MKRFYETYVEKFKSNPATILEIGSRDGDDAEELRKYSQLELNNVYVVEPHPGSYRSIINKYPHTNVYNFAISNKPGVLDFNAIPLSYPQSIVGTSSLLKRSRSINIPNSAFPEHWIKVLAVTGTTLLELINQREIDIVKIDVEGFTYEVLQSFGDNVRLMKALHLEVEIPPLSLWDGQKYYDEVKKYMTWYGFEEKYYDGKYWITPAGEKLQGDSVWTRND